MSDGARTLRAELARKALHLATASLPIAWAFGAVDTRDLRIVLGVATGVALAIEAARLAAPRVERAFVAVVGRLLRAHENGHLTGATWLAIAMAAVVWLAPQRAALVALWAAAVGDASGAIVGRGVARLRGRESPRKSIVGSLAIALTTAGGASWLAAAPWSLALSLGACAALAEWPRRPFDDNLRVTIAVALAAIALGVR